MDVRNIASAALRAGILAIGLAGTAGAQVVTNPNQIQTTVRFTNVNPEILGVLNRPTDVPPGAGQGLRHAWIGATSLPPHAPPLSHSTDTPASTGTRADAELTVEAGGTGSGIAYAVRASGGLMNGSYEFDEVPTPPVEAEPAPDRTADLAECAALVRGRSTDDRGTSYATVE